MGGDDDVDPPDGKIENPHTVNPLQKRKKNQKNSQEIDIFYDLQNMEVDDFSQIPNLETSQLVESKVVAEELAREGPIIFYDDSISLHHTNYQIDSRKLLLQCVKIKGKHVIETWGLEIEIKTIDPNEMMELHTATGEDLAHTMDDQGKENSQIK